MVDQYITIGSQYGHTMGLLVVTQHVVDLLLCHVSPILLVALCAPKTPGVDTVEHVGPHTPLTVAPKVAMGISIFCVGAPSCPLRSSAER